MPIEKLLVPLRRFAGQRSCITLRGGHRTPHACRAGRCAGGSEPVPSRDHGGKDYLAWFDEGLESRGLTVETAVAPGAAADWIVEQVTLRHADLVIMATHDRTGADRLFRGSVAEAVMKSPDKPVLIVRAAEGMRPAERFQHRQPLLVVPLDGSASAEAALPFAELFANELGGALVLVLVIPAAGIRSTSKAWLLRMTIAPRSACVKTRSRTCTR